MPPRLRPIAPEATAERLELRPETVTLDAVKAIYARLGEDAERDGHHELKVEAFAMAEVIQELVEIPEPVGLVASARLIAAADIAVLDAADLRADTAQAYDRFDAHTAQATEALEILTAYVALLEKADLDLRCGTLAA